MVEVHCEELCLPETKIEYQQPLQDFLNGTVDDIKRSITLHVFYADSFRPLRRHFQLMLRIEHSQEWEGVSFDLNIRKCLNLHQVGLRKNKYTFKVALNPGQTPATCGKA